MERMPVFNFGTDIGIDLGTASVLIYEKGKGIILHEPSVVAMNQRSGEIIAVGKEARKMLGRTPGDIVAVRPLKEGVIADYDTTEKMLRYFIKKVCNNRLFFRPRVMICIPSGVTEVEERAVRQAAEQAGARKAFLMEEPLAAALGAGLDISEPGGNMIVDIGGGTTDVAVLSLNGIVCSKSLRIGGDKFDEAIVRFARKEYNLLIGERFAEEIKIEVGTAYIEDLKENRTIEVRGRNLITGLPNSVCFSAFDVYDALQEPLEVIVGAVKEVLEVTPPELAADIIDKGIILTGGGALLHGIDKLLAKETGLPMHIAEDPIFCVARGTGVALQHLNALQNTRSFATKQFD